MIGVFTKKDVFFFAKGLGLSTNLNLLESEWTLLRKFMERESYPYSLTTPPKELCIQEHLVMVDTSPKFRRVIAPACYTSPQMRQDLVTKLKNTSVVISFPLPHYPIYTFFEAPQNTEGERDV